MQSNDLRGINFFTPWWKYPETSSFLGNNYYKQNMTKAIFQSDGITTAVELVIKFANS